MKETEPGQDLPLEKVVEMVLATGQEKETMGTAWDLASEMVMEMGTAWDLASEMVVEKGWVAGAVGVVVKLESLKYNFRQY